MEPISLVLAAAAAGGVSGKLAEVFTSYLTDIVRGHDQLAQEKAAHNAARFLAQLTTLVGRLDERITESVIGDRWATDPDIASVMRTAITTAARTSDEVRQGVLARAVAERLASQSETTRAIIISRSIEVLGMLSRHHLKCLGLLVLVYSIRPYPREGDYLEWLMGKLDYWSKSNSETLTLRHLASASCLLYEAGVERDIAFTLQLPRAFCSSDEHSQILTALHAYVRENNTGRALYIKWEAGLQHVSLSPVGIALGYATYDFHEGVITPVDWDLIESEFML